MTFKKWLRKIALFPLSIIMAVPDGEDSGGPSLNERIMAFAGNPEAQHMPVAPPDAAASEDEAADADQQGNQGEDAEDSNGLDTTAEEADPDADQDEDDAEDADETDQKGEEGKGTKKRTLEERAAEIAAKIVSDKLAERDKLALQEQPDFTVVDMAKVEAYIADTEERINELRLEGKYTEARQLSRQLDQLDADLEANEQKRQAWVARQQQKQAGTVNLEAEKKDFAHVAELYRQELKVDPATWQKMGEWFGEKVNTIPILNAEFNEIRSRQGKVAAIRFAHDYTVKNMGQQTKQATQKKEQSKTKQAALTATTTGKQAPVDLSKAKAEFAANPTPEAFAKFQALKRQAKG